MAKTTITANQFRDVREQDLTKIPKDLFASLVTWRAGMEHRGVGREYVSDSDIIKYYDVWDIWETMPRYLTLDEEKVAKSHLVTQTIFDNLDRPEGHRSFNGEPMPIDRLNAEDFYFQNAYQLPGYQKVKNILDFGAGTGRQVNIWSQQEPDLVYCSMEAIEMGYMVQNYHYSNVPGFELFDYVANPDSFEITSEKGIYHLPTWRADLLPENFFDLVIAVMVFPEIDETLISYMIGKLAEVIRPGGALYIRDHDLTLPAHKLDVDRLLTDNGFVLEFRPYIADRKDIHGLPRLWRKLDEKVPHRSTEAK